ncbi:hypothetical protein ABE85_15905 [Mitsuaria sp. 7]|nr:hypothetical protein ABE85_15905 [Mitsuaria sp. 7]
MLDLGFRPETFADDPPAAGGAPGTEAPVYGPEDVPSDGPVFMAFRASEEGQRATAQMTRCIDTIARFAHDRGKTKVAEDIRLFKAMLVQEKPSVEMHAPYLALHYSKGKRSLEQIAAMLVPLETCVDGREREALRCLKQLGEGMYVCGSRIEGELSDAENWLRQLGGGLKKTVQYLCRNTADVAIVDTLVRSGADAKHYLTNSHVRRQLEARVGLPWAQAPGDDLHFIQPRDFPRRIQECRAAVRRSVTPAAIARQLASDCLHEVRTSLREKTHGAPTLDHDGMRELKDLVKQASGRFGSLKAHRFVRGDAFSEPMRMTDDPQAVLSSIRMNLVTAHLVDNKKDVLVWKEDVDGTEWKLVLRQGDLPAVIEDDGGEESERSAQPADWQRVLRKLASSGTAGSPFTRRLSDPAIQRRMIDGAMAAQTTPPETWDAELLAVPGVLSQVCESMEDRAAARLLSGIAGRPDAGGPGLAPLALELALQRKLAASVVEVVGGMDVADLRTAWPPSLPLLAGALAEGNDALADAGLTALDRLSPTADQFVWRSCRKELHDWRRGMQAWLTGASTLPPWPEAALQRLGSLHREGLLSAPVLATLLQGDARLGIFVDRVGARPLPERRPRFLASLERACVELGLSPHDIRRLVPTAQGLGGPVTDNGLEATAPRFWQLPPAQLEEALIYRAHQGYGSVDDLVRLLRQFLDYPDSLVAPFSWQGSLGAIKRLSSDGVLSHSDCVGLLSNTLPSIARRFDWRSRMLQSSNLPALRDYLDVVEHLAVKHGDLVDVDDLLHVCVDGGDPYRPRPPLRLERLRPWRPHIHERDFPAQRGRIPLASYDPQVRGALTPSFNLALDFAVKAAQRGWITSSQLSSHLAAGGSWAGNSVLPLLLGVEPDEHPFTEGDDAFKQTHLRSWLSRLVDAGRGLSGADLVDLLRTPHRSQQMTPMHLAVTQGSASQLSLFLDWLVTATEPDNALQRRLVQVVQGGTSAGDCHVAFDALRLGRYEALKAWLTGIRRLREADRLNNAQYVTLLVPDGDGDRHAIDAVAHADARASVTQSRALVCARLLREAALDGQSRGWIDADDLRDILDPLVQAGLINDQDAPALHAATDALNDLL